VHSANHSFSMCCECIDRGRSRRPDKPMYVPRALRLQNAASTSSSSNAVTVGNQSSASVTHHLSSVDVDDSLSGKTDTEPSADTGLSAAVPDCSPQTTSSCTEKKSICRTNEKPRKVGCRDSVKKPSKSGEKSKLGSFAKDVQSSQAADTVVSNVLTVNEASDDDSPSCTSSVEPAPRTDAPQTDAPQTDQQTVPSYTAQCCTVDELVDAGLLHQRAVNCSVTPIGTCNDEDNTVLSASNDEDNTVLSTCNDEDNTVLSASNDADNTVLSADVGDRHKTLESNEAVSVTVDELASDVTRTSVIESNNSVQHQQQQEQCDCDNQLETVIASNVTTTESLSHSLSITAAAAASNTANHSRRNSDIDDDDDDDDDDNWEKMFDDSGEMLNHSGDIQV